MPSFCVRRRVVGLCCVSWILAMSLLQLAEAGPVKAQEAMSSQDGPRAQAPAPVVREAAESQAEPNDAPTRPVASASPLSNYDPVLFQKRVPKDQLTFLGQFAGAPSSLLYEDKQFRKLMHSFVPDCTFHYGTDKSLSDALDEVIKRSREPVQIRDGRYVMLSGHQGRTSLAKGFSGSICRTELGSVRSTSIQPTANHPQW